MAHMQKCTKADVYGLAVHYERRDGCELSNKSIDKARSQFNYNLAHEMQPLTPEEFINQRVGEVKHLNRKDVIQMVDWIITLPKNVLEKDEKNFFIYTFDFVCERYGKQNVVCAWVHKDETTPHIHIAFVPVRVVDGIEKLDCKNIMTKLELKSFHPELGEYLEERLGYLPEIQNDATINGNRSIKELKNQEDLSLKKSLSNIHKHIDASEQIVAESEKIEFETTKLLKKQKSLVKANEVIDELKHSNKQLKTDVNSLKKTIEVQKEEIDLYRRMPLAKQLEQKKETIEELCVSVNLLNEEINKYKDEIKWFNNESEKKQDKISTLENKLFIHEKFLSILGLDNIFNKFKKVFVSNGYRLHLFAVKELCVKVIDKVNIMLNVMNDRISFLERNNKQNLNDYVYREANDFKNNKKGER